MIEEAWNEYRGWAKRARSLQRSTRQWNRAALVCGGMVAIFGAAASQVPNGLLFGKAMAFMAAVLAAITPVLGREILSVGGEAQWIRARATAEAIKSECFRFAAQLGDYAGSSAKDVFVARRNALTEPAERAGLTPLHDPVPTTGDARRPPIPLTVPWYMENRVGEQVQRRQTCDNCAGGCCQRHTGVAFTVLSRPPLRRKTSTAQALRPCPFRVKLYRLTTSEAGPLCLRLLPNYCAAANVERGQGTKSLRDSSLRRAACLRVRSPG
jgi:hypothetical protein